MKQEIQGIKKNNILKFIFCVILHYIVLNQILSFFSRLSRIIYLLVIRNPIILNAINLPRILSSYSINIFLFNVFELVVELGIIIIFICLFILMIKYKKIIFEYFQGIISNKNSIFIILLIMILVLFILSQSLVVKEFLRLVVPPHRMF